MTYYLKNILLCSIILSVLIISGCGVKLVKFDSIPQGAIIKFYDKELCETPCVGNVPDGVIWQFSANKDGYDPVVRSIPPFQMPHDGGTSEPHIIFQLKKIKNKVYSLGPHEERINNSAPVASKKWAVIIGISKYQYSGINGLSNLIFADDDAKAFARSLRNLGWNESHVKILTNEEATQRNIMIALESWLTKAGSSDQIILFWAGHGFPDPEDPEKVYFATYDTDVNIPATGYRMDRVRATLEERKSKNVILFADTCHAGKLITRGDRGISIVPNIRKQNIPKGWVFMVGAETDRQAVEDTSWSNGAFTHSLINGLNGDADGFQSAGAKDGVVTMGELRTYMNISMPEETQKVLGVAKRPVITTSTGDPEIWNLSLNVSN